MGGDVTCTCTRGMETCACQYPCVHAPVERSASESIGWGQVAGYRSAVVDALLAAGADPKAKDRVSGWALGAWDDACCCASRAATCHMHGYSVAHVAHGDLTIFHVLYAYIGAHVGLNYTFTATEP